MATESLKINKFTLIELIVAIGIMMAISGIVAMASWSFYRNYEQAAQTTSKIQEFMAIDRLMDSYIRNMIPFQWKDENSNTRFVFSGEKHKLHFTTLRRTYGVRGGALLFVRLFVEEGRLIAEYSRIPRLPWKEDDESLMPYEREVIAEKVESITFSYAEKVEEDEDGDGTGVEWLENWAEEEHAALPLAIRLTVKWEDGHTEYWLRRVAGIAKDSTFGVRKTYDGESNRFSNPLEGDATGGGGGDE